MTCYPQLKVLVACEHSGSVRDALTHLGHDALSCDLKPSNTPGKHYQGNVLDIIDRGFDLMIGFPPCTYLAKVQEWRCQQDPVRKMKQLQAVEFFRALINAPITCIALENPAGFLTHAFRASNQIIRPWWFGDPYEKEIQLWTKNLPPIMATCYSPFRKSISNHVNGRMSQDLKSEIKSSWTRFPGMAHAIADQYSKAATSLVYPSGALLTVSRPEK